MDLIITTSDGQPPYLEKASDRRCPDNSGRPVATSADGSLQAASASVTVESSDETGCCC